MDAIFILVAAKLRFFKNSSMVKNGIWWEVMMMASYSTSWQPCLHGTQFCLFLDENLTGIDNKIWLNLKFCYGNRHFGRGDASRNGGHPITLSNDRMAKEINFSLRSCMKLSQWCPISLSFLPNQNSSPTSWNSSIFFWKRWPHDAPAAPAAHANRQSLLQQHRSWFQQAVKERPRKPRPRPSSLKVTSDLFILNHGYFG